MSIYHMFYKSEPICAWMPKQTSKELYVKTIRPILSDTCLSCLPDCDAGVLWLNGWMDQDETRMQIGLGPGHIVLDGDPATPTERGTAAPHVWNLQAQALPASV